MAKMSDFSSLSRDHLEFEEYDPEGISREITGFNINSDTINFTVNVKAKLNDQEFNNSYKLSIKKHDIQKIKIPDGVTSIGNGAFENNQLTQVKWTQQFDNTNEKNRIFGKNNWDKIKFIQKK